MVIGLDLMKKIKIKWSYSMARNWIGNKKVTKDDMYTKVRVTEADVRWEYVKLLCWLGLGYGYYHFAIAGWMW